MRISDWSSDVCSSDLAGTIFVVERVNRNASAGVDAPTCAWRIIICPSADIVVRDRDELCRSQMPVFAGDAVQGHHHGLRQDRFMDRIGGRLLALQQRHQSRNDRSEEHTSELQSLMRISYAVFCLT